MSDMQQWVAFLFVFLKQFGYIKGSDLPDHKEAMLRR